jgi:hypothetical protein
VDDLLTGPFILSVGDQLGDGRRRRAPAARAGHAKRTGGGAIPGTDPVKALLAKERKNGRRAH